MKTKKGLKWIAAIMIVLAFIVLTIWLTPKILSLRQEETQIKFRGWVDSLGIWSYFLMLFLQILQIMVAFLPGEPIELMLGLMYGTFGGLFLCLIGIGIGTSAVFFIVQKFGMKFVNKFVNSKEFEKLKFLHDPAKRDSFLFLLFFIPGTPKDVLTYFAPFTKISPWRFLLISMIARIPSVISSTYVGSTLSKGNLWSSVIIFACTGILGLAGIWINNRIIHKQNQ